MDDYLLIAVDAQAKVAIRFARLDCLVSESLALHDLSDADTRAHFSRFISGSVLLGSRQDEQLTLLFKMTFAGSEIRFNCETTSRGAARAAVFPRGATHALKNPGAALLRVVTLNRRGETYESHVQSHDHQKIFSEYLATSQQSLSRICLPGVSAHGDKNKHYSLWVESLPGTTVNEWQERTRGLTDELWAAIEKIEDPDIIMNRLFPGGFRILAVTKPKLTCSCNAEKAADLLTLLTEQERDELKDAGGRTVITCEYCQKEWVIA